MKISLNSASIQSWEGSILLIGVFQDQFQAQLADLDKVLSKLLSENLAEKGFHGKDGDTACFNLLEERVRKLVFIGLGESEHTKIHNLRDNVAIGLKYILGETGTLGVYLPWESFQDKSATANAVAESIRLSLFKDNRFKSDPEPNLKPDKIELIGISNSDDVSLENINPICSGVELARELVAAPPNSLTPEALANKALLIAKEFSLDVKILEQEDCESKGMGAYLAVSSGSDLPPKFIHLTYKPPGKIKKTIAIVGKGLTFDSGGYNLKVGGSQIEMMKFDMGGSAAVLGTARAIGEMKPLDIEIHFIIAACENMINGSAVHPGDIVKASNGKTIEINNTDAEGRLTLADALVYASALQPKAIVDLATLTGACVIALGEEIAGFWSESDELAKKLEDSSKDSGEGLWRMPLHKPYKDGLKSMLADLKNTGPRPGGSITAALFLSEFINKGIDWAHIDIAGTVWTDKNKGINPPGATGYGVRTLVKWVYKEAEN